MKVNNVAMLCDKTHIPVSTDSELRMFQARAACEDIVNVLKISIAFSELLT